MRRLLLLLGFLQWLSHKHLKGISLILFALVFMTQAQAGTEFKFPGHFKMDRTITGQVTDSSGQPLQGVSVTLPGTQLGTSTDSRGQYMLRVPDSYTGGIVVFSSTGFQRQRVNLGISR